MVKVKITETQNQDLEKVHMKGYTVTTYCIRVRLKTNLMGHVTVNNKSVTTYFGF